MWLSPVLDLGAGAGRAALYLQERGLPVTAVDASPGAAEVCRRRGVADVRLGDVNDPPEDRRWAAVVLLCGNLGLGGSWDGSRRLLAGSLSWSCLARSWPVIGDSDRAPSDRAAHPLSRPGHSLVAAVQHSCLKDGCPGRGHRVADRAARAGRRRPRRPAAPNLEAGHPGRVSSRPRAGHPGAVNSRPRAGHLGAVNSRPGAGHPGAVNSRPRAADHPGRSAVDLVRSGRFLGVLGLTLGPVSALGAASRIRAAAGETVTSGAAPGESVTPGGRGA